LNDFIIIEDDDEDLFTTDVPLKSTIWIIWWGKFVSVEHRANIAHEEGEEYADSEELVSLDGSDDDGTNRRRRRYREFNENHDMRIQFELEKGLMFADTHVFKMTLKWYVVQHEFDFKYKHNDRVRASAVCNKQDCDWRIQASFMQRKNQYK